MKIARKTCYLKCVIGIVVIAALFGCSKNKTDVTLSELLKDPGSIQAELNWCGQQPNPSMIMGCQNATQAKFVVDHPALLDAWNKPEPWPNKDHDFFVKSRLAELAQLQLDSGQISYVRDKQAAIAQLKELAAAVPPSQRHAQEEEDAWCAVQAVKAKTAADKNDEQSLPVKAASCGALGIRAQELLIGLK